MSTISLIGKNLRFMIINRIVTLIVSFLIFPYIIMHTGQEIYGVYLTVMTITGYFGLLDFGVMSALTKYVSEYNGKGDLKKVNNIINASFTFYILIGIIAAILLFFLSKYFTLFFKISIANIDITRNLFIIASVSAIFVWPLSAFRGTIEGLNLWNIEAIINMLVQILNGLSAYAIFSKGYGIIHFFISSQLLTIIGNIAFFVISKKRTGLNLIFPYVNINTFKHIFNFSFFMFLSSLLNLFLFQIHNIIIGSFLSMSKVTIYAVAHNIQNYFRYINSTLGGPPWTVASEMEGRGDIDGQRKLLFKGTKYITAIFIPMVLIVFFFAEPFIKYWMGPGFEESVLPTKIIVLFWVFNGTLEMASGMLSAKGIVKKPLYIHICVAITNIIIGISLIQYIDINAIALGLTISMVFVAFPFLLRLSLNSLQITIREYFDKAIKDNILIYALTVVVSYLTMHLFYPKNLFYAIAEMASIYVLVIAVLCCLIFMKTEEKLEIKQLLGIQI
ncbi:MAG TPA: MATE family efflux transporter [Syntrophorhabdaceae bacterium]|nr:MATE family efflux transporter [Syntrophorhabdaceae bacterium]